MAVSWERLTGAFYKSCSLWFAFVMSLVGLSHSFTYDIGAMPSASVLIMCLVGGFLYCVDAGGFETLVNRYGIRMS